MSATDVASIAGASGRILVVDDNPADIQLTEEMFGEVGLHPVIDSARDGVEAVDHLGRVLDGSDPPPHIVLLDINMPRMNGVEVLKDIKQIDETIAVIMVTANEQVQLAADALKSGAFGYVPKPFDFRYLDHMLATILDKPRNARK